MKTLKFFEDKNREIYDQSYVCISVILILYITLILITIGLEQLSLVHEDFLKE